ncbi:TAT-variant-translocated molybdopterin oxidoreductase [Pseudoflavitalea sp. G-6-1-2]|uniref:TAT-variant-translocated molybdopterin oxidoreductase n=1 Tax=Pseudoflavitalea sp. G-6-1-2 TaxID=2728841 RepID=UPI00146F5B6F|nr:TAT-variant-translocated molybdopterin oxidoreductase [Pseudoflavitalea sp. G-6-1-2]NML19865.1 TAT-variant-translocated molybdopterin oxidoreductase [Pseudoflavitalea sp. G-6-1-2]
MAKKKYWQSFTELNHSEAHQKLAENEFNEDLPVEGAADKGLANANASRRDFLKYLGFSTAAAMAAASCETPVRKAVPYVNRPQDIVPGVADYYATTYISGGEAIPVVAKVRDGRPIKIEGNTLSTHTKGATTARVQASVLDLYDTARLRNPEAKGTAVAYDVIDKQIMDELAALNGAPIVLLTSTINSPSTKQIIGEFLAKYPGSRQVQFDAASYSGVILANEATYGKKAIPSYQFENAKVIVSLGADFLATWLSPVEFQRGYSAGRKVNEKNPDISKHYQFESMMSLTGSNADERYTHRPSETGVVAAALLSAINGQGAAGVDGKLKKGIEAAAADLVANKGKALVVAGSNNVNIQIIVNAINEAIGANGTTINFAAPILTHQGLDAEMAQLVSDMEGGKVGALLIAGVNPAYEYFDGEKFKKALNNVKVTISFNEKLDESTKGCKYVLPAPHFLESWGDAEFKAGQFSMIQPTINPLFQTRPMQDSLLKWAGNATAYDVYFKNYWTSKLGSADNYNKALQDGVIETAIAPAAAAFNSAAVAAALTAAAGMKKAGKVEVVIYQKVAIGDGKQGNNPWLLEMPDPITRVSWDNYAMIGTTMAKEMFGIDLSTSHGADKYEVEVMKPVLELTIGNKKVELPIMVIPGMQSNTIAVAVGYGRASEIGRAVVNMEGKPLGTNVYPLLSYNGTTVEWAATDKVEVKNLDKTYKIAQVQNHNSYEGRHEVVKEVTLDEFKKDPKQILNARAKELAPWGGLENYEKEGTLYPVHDRPGIKWGMSIDLNSCYGCGACVVACNAENNIPVVGKYEVARFHDMHWLRIDRYFSGNPNDPDSVQTVFMPMLCQHCDNAPCENVCPVAATNHSSEGLNQMTYNRCIGTRYCANNCPFKVRRFNWADYTGADSFANNQKPLVEEGKLDDVVLMMNDELTRMVLNPDVTVRSRGVIEKCSFCVQRLQEGKLKAKKAGRPLEDGDIKTACQQACAADAIVFGNANNPESEISKVRKENGLRLYHALEQIHVMPNINYLAKVRNSHEIANEGHLSGEVFKKEEATPAAEHHTAPAH